jgi:thymidylate kinase
MLVEFTGSTGSGKSILSSKVIEKLSTSDRQVISANELMLARLGAIRFKNTGIQRFLINALAILEFSRSAKRYADISFFAARVLKQHAHSPVLRFYLCRNIIRRLGIYTAIRGRDIDNQIVIFDEGTLHIAHNLFVHPGSAPSLDSITAFANLAPLPDVVVLIRTPIDFCAECIWKQGHRRLKGKSKAEVEQFIKQAHQVFEHLVTTEQVKRRLLIVDNSDHSIGATQATVQHIADSILDTHSRFISSRTKIH